MPQPPTDASSSRATVTYASPIGAAAASTTMPSIAPFGAVAMRRTSAVAAYATVTSTTCSGASPSSLSTAIRYAPGSSGSMRNVPVRSVRASPSSR